jgi:hypothetical protein
MDVRKEEHNKLAAKYANRIKQQNFEKDAIGDTIVIFVHIPKTAGTSVNEAFRSLLPLNDTFMVRSFDLVNTPTKHLIKFLSNPNITLTKGKVTYIEIHGPGTPAFIDFPTVSIRRNIQKNNGNLFIFTVLRNPLDTVISLRTYLCDFLKTPIVVEADCCRVPNFSKCFPDVQLNYLAGRMPPQLVHMNSNMTHDVMSSMKKLDHVGFLDTLPKTFQLLEEFIVHSSPGFNTSVLKKKLPHTNAHVPSNKKDNKQEASAIVSLQVVRESQRQDLMLYSHFLERDAKMRGTPTTSFLPSTTLASTTSRLLLISSSTDVDTSINVWLYSIMFIFLIFSTLLACCLRRSHNRRGQKL